MVGRSFQQRQQMGMLGWSPRCPKEGAEDLFSKITAVLGCQAPRASGDICNSSSLMVCVQ